MTNPIATAETEGAVCALLRDAADSASERRVRVRRTPRENDGYIRGWNALCAEVLKSRVQVWRDIKAGKFPAPLEIGPNSLAWKRDEVDAWRANSPRRNYGSSAKPAAA